MCDTWRGEETSRLNRTNEIKRVIRRAIDDLVDLPRHLTANKWRSRSKIDVRSSSGVVHRTVSIFRDFPLTWAIRGTPWFARSPSGGGRSMRGKCHHDHGAAGSCNRDRPLDVISIRRWIAPHEEPRSTRDRGLIGARSWRIQHQIGALSSRNRRHSSSTSSDGLWSRIDGTIDARSQRDRDPNVPRSGLILKQNRVLFKANLEATSSPSESAPTTLQIRSHDRFNCPRFLG